MILQRNPKIGVVIPSHNNLNVLKHSVPSIYDDAFMIVLFDDGSTDGTAEWVGKNYPKVHILRGDGNCWWTGAVARLIDYCLVNNCDYIISLNADVLITPESAQRLVSLSMNKSDAIVASLVVDVLNPERVLWAGSLFDKIHKLIPIYASKYIYKSGSSVKSLPKGPYVADEVHGRGVVLPASVIRSIGNYDWERFPQYGGDTEFSFRASRNGIKMFIDPSCLAKVFSDNTSIGVKAYASLPDRLLGIKDYLFKRKNGEAAIVWWRLYRRYLPLKFFVQSYIFVLIWNVYRRLGK
jgi:GT2 family glycosyltransferase